MSRKINRTYKAGSSAPPLAAQVLDATRSPKDLDSATVNLIFTRTDGTPVFTKAAVIMQRGDGLCPIQEIVRGDTTDIVTEEPHLLSEGDLFFVRGLEGYPAFNTWHIAESVMPNAIEVPVDSRNQCDIIEGSGEVVTRGLVQYNWVPTDLVVGSYYAQFEITKGGQTWVYPPNKKDSLINVVS